MKSRTWAILALLVLGGAFMLYQRPDTPGRILIIHRPANFEATLKAVESQHAKLLAEGKPVPAELAATLKEYTTYRGKLALVIDNAEEVAGLMEKIDVFFCGTTTAPPAPQPPIIFIAKRDSKLDEVLWKIELYADDTLLWEKHDREQPGLYQFTLDRCGIVE